jgi:hypothetical protein
MRGTAIARNTYSVAALGGVALVTALGLGVAWMRHRYFCALCEAVRRLKTESVRQRPI